MKRYTIIIAFAFISIASYSQEIELGIKGGLNIASLGQANVGYPSRLAYHAGLYSEFLLTPFFSVQPEIVYSLQGALIDRTNNIYLNYHYLNIPVSSKIYFYEKASLDLGIQFGLLLSAVEKDDLYTDNQTDQVRGTDFSLLLGVSYKLDEKFNFAIRYNLGISNTAGVNTIYENRLTNKVLQLSLGYVLNN